MKVIALRLKSARIMGDEEKVEKLLNERLAKRKEYQLEGAQRRVDYADTIRDANEMIGAYQQADKWEQKRIAGLKVLAATQAAWGDGLAAVQTRLEAMSAELERQEALFDRYVGRLEGMVGWLSAAGAPIARQTAYIRALARAERERFDALVAEGRSPYDPEVIEHYTAALEHSVRARREERDLIHSQYEVMKEMYDQGIIGEETLNRKRETALKLARQQIALARDGSREQVEAWRTYLGLMEDAGSQMDKAVAKILGGPADLLDFLSPVDLAARFGGAAAIAMGTPVGGTEVDILGRYKHRTLIELRYPQEPPPALEAGITAGIDGFVNAFVRQLEQG